MINRTISKKEKKEFHRVMLLFEDLNSIAVFKDKT